jgi:uncharacterized protein (DUF2126 family)/transglutaminase-like putative cysteine protease
MAIRVALHHVSHYRYDRLVQLGPHVVRLRPAPHSRTPISAYSLRVTPDDHFLNWQQDPFGNWQARLVFPKPAARELKVEVDLVADLTTINPFDFFIEEYAEHVPFTYEKVLAHELRPYLECNETGERFEQLVGRAKDDILRPKRRCVDVLVDLNQLVQRSLRYDIRMEPGVFAPEESLTRGHGSCRDFAWLLVHLLRNSGFAARFVSGYSIQLRADQLAVKGPIGVTEDCTDLHAWAEVYLPGAGWIGLDATSGLMCGEGHIPLACTAEPGTAAPVSGSYGWGKDHEEDELEEKFEVTMTVERIEDRPRPTKPFNDAQWQALVAAGERVEQALVEGDVRLTLGGEPTFVATDDPDGDEWNTTAVGPNKERYADRLLRRLQARFAPGSLLHHGQGKWYPGEPLPRFAYSCYFRTDGEPIWRDPKLLTEASATRNDGAVQADGFVRALAERLGIREQFIVPGFEDTFYYLWRERRLPINVDPFDSKLEDKQERARLRRVFAHGLSSVVGYTLPLRPSWANDALSWSSGPWFIREERMYLMPGDSPMGFRLPLDSLPWSAPGDTVAIWERDPTAARENLPPRSQLARPPVSAAAAAAAAAERAASAAGRGPGSAGRHAAAPLGPPGIGQSATELTRTALCVEPRNGFLHVFMPPCELLEEYLDLVAAIEDTAAALAQPVRIEGYQPPSDHRIQRLQVTPDPGVIEVNIHPAASWADSVDNTQILYEEAKQCGLSSDKFMLDGRHVGTGGGNHITLGAATPLDSPFLRRPDLLRSMLGYWLNHPSLSYLFSGLFVGPTSQAPRIDEARHDSLYELDIAFGALAPNQGEAPPWLVDRVFRHLLVDVTGNTHRTEMCIDKLYSPDSAAGRQGLLELRGFEMPPDARMSCAAQLLVRGLLAKFWKEPYTQKVVRWGTTLFDRFMLPEFVAADFRDVLHDLRSAGFAFEDAWFAPQQEFRFPFVGRVASAGVEVELRQAIEPWHVLGEQPSGGATSRYVDTSVERMQVKVSNMTDPRHVLTCNGRRVPLHPTGTAGEYVGGVRYRAWKPPNALHPTIDAHGPLVFDLLDTWAKRAIGGCTYHVAHPGGLSYESFPHNALEAEARRNTRFWPFGHTPGSRAIPELERNESQPLTLDLRTPSGNC